MNTDNNVTSTSARIIGVGGLERFAYYGLRDVFVLLRADK